MLMLQMAIERASVARLRQRVKQGVYFLFPPVMTAICLLALWQGAILFFHIPAYIAPDPSVIAGQLISQQHLILANLWPTCVEALSGFLLGNGLAVCVAVWLTHHPLAERCVYPLAVVVHTIPVLAVAPILVLILGTGYTPRIAIVALVCFFPMLVNTVRGLKSVSPQTIELMKILYARDMETLVKVRVPSSLPFIFSALKVTAPASVIGAVIGEWIGASYGLGSMILEATYNFRSPLLYAAVFACSVLALVLFVVVAAIERLLTRWAPLN
ncbi:ABC transporter permease [Gluconacetobacter asukensis]